MFDIITIGSATRDAFIRSDVFVTIEGKQFKTGRAECIPLGSKLEVPEITFTSGGGATNAAATFGRQGLRVAAISKVGKDVSGEEVKQELKKNNVNSDLIITSANLPTAYSIILITEKGDRSVLVYRGASASFMDADVKVKNLDANWFYISSLAGKISILEKIIKHKKKSGAKVAVNPGSGEIKQKKRLVSLLKDIDVLIMNREEGSFLTDIKFEKLSEIFDRLDGWVKELVVLTDGKNGVMVSDGKSRWQAGVFPEETVADRTGAGDAFGSGFDSARARGLGVEEAIRIGSANATSVVEHVGAKTGILKRREVNKDRWQKLEIKKMKINA